MAVKVEDMADAIAEILATYTNEVTEAVKEDVRTVAKECVKEIKNNAPKLTGDYKKSWKLKKAYESNRDIRFVIHSAKEYRLTHLLEHGHAKVSGGRVPAYPHIRPAEENAEKNLMKKVEVSIQGGNS